jgi:hypothetical protein
VVCNCLKSTFLHEVTHLMDIAIIWRITPEKNVLIVGGNDRLMTMRYQKHALAWLAIFICGGFIFAEAEFYYFSLSEMVERSRLIAVVCAKKIVYVPSSEKPSLSKIKVSVLIDQIIKGNGIKDNNMIEIVGLYFDSPQFKDGEKYILFLTNRNKKWVIVQSFNGCAPIANGRVYPKGIRNEKPNQSLTEFISRIVRLTKQEKVPKP